MVTKFFLFLLCASYPVANSITTKEIKQCCGLGTNFASSGHDCKDFKPEWAGPRLANEKVCLSTVDVCCKKENREKQCMQGTTDAMNGVSCPSDDGDRKDCCEACQAGIDNARAQDQCSGLGLGAPYDDAFNRCCEDYKTSISTSTTTLPTTTTTKATTVTRPTSTPNNNYFNTPVENICDSDVCAQMCEPVGDSFKCDCYKGFILMEDGISCRPEKRILKKGGRCESHNPCDHDCIDTGTAIKCSCREGYQLADDNRTCKDIDECLLGLHDCTTVEDCINEIGTYSCYDPILDNETIDFENKCPTGYKYNFNNLLCDDINECQFDLICAPPKTCLNTIGSFECVGDDVPKCPPGFHYKDATESCTDNDECLNGQNDCNKESQFCVNTKGNYTCVDKASRNSCPPGFKKNSITQLCDDINECEEEDKLCDENETCINEPGGHTCVPIQNKPTTKVINKTTTITPKTSTTPATTTQKIICPRGYSYVEENHVCTDINECQVGLHNCAVAERCDNTIGSYHCSRIFGCGTGYTLNSANGLCEDDDECVLGSHHCRELGPNFKCRNTLGSYRCEPIRQYYTPSSSSSSSGSSSSTTTTTERSYPRSPPSPQNPSKNAAAYTPPENQTPVYEPHFVSSRVYTVQTTPSTTTIHSYPNYNPYPTPPRSNNSIVAGTLFPIGRFTTPSTTTTSTTITPRPTLHFRPHSTVTDETLPYYSPKIKTTGETLPYYSPKSTTNSYTTVHFGLPERPTPLNPYYDIINGQFRKCLPGYRINFRGQCEDIDECKSNPCGRNEKCLNFNGRFECVPPMQCKIGYELNESGDSCVDVNECSRGINKCKPTQICKNYEGYYTCECPPGHHSIKNTNECEDLDECRMYRPCRFSSSQCVNLKGSFRCDCKPGFQKNKTINECDDVDECSQTPELCEHNCVNIWGSYRCSCHQGFTLNRDNRSCTDIDECERFKDRRLCIGNCKNVPGSYVCECPPGYKLGSDGRTCLDINECAQNVCLNDEVCLNTRGGFKCYRINCPPNYIKDREHKSRCKRLQSLCDPRDYKCILMPEQYTYQYITLVSNLPLTAGHINLFKIKGPEWYSSRAEFTLKLLDVVCPRNIDRVNESYFTKVNDQFNSIALYLVRPIQGPQEIKLQIEMRLFQGNVIIGNTVVYIIIVVSEFPF